MKVLTLICAVCVLSSCGSSEKHSTPTSGNIKIAIDETFQPVMDAQIEAYHGLYKYTNINPLYLPEAQAMRLFLDDSVQIAVVARKLTEQEVNYFKSRRMFPVTVEVAHDAIAMITHPSNRDTSLTMDQLKGIFSGKITTWSQLETGSPLGDIRIVFDDAYSSTARFIRERFTKELPGNCFSAESNPGVVEYVAKNPNTIGVIGVNYISDTDDTTSIDFLTRTNVLRISADSTDLRGKQPYQAYIAEGSYPLRRSIFMINSEGRTGLGTGFTSYVASDKGQSIILKAGLVPATMPVRIIDFEN